MIGTGRRQHHWVGPAVAVVVVAAVVAALVGAVRDAHPTRSQLRQETLAWVVLSRPSIEASNRSGLQVSDLRYRPGDLGLVGVQQDLAQVTGSTASVATGVATAAYPTQDAQARARLLGVMRERTSAARLLQTGITGALSGGRFEAQVADLVTAGREMSAADAGYRAFVAALPQQVRRAAGLPESRWVGTRDDWSPFAISDYVSGLQAVPSLLPTHQVEMVTVGMSPQPVSVASPADPVTNLPPSPTLGLTAVVVNSGNQAEHGVAVVATLIPQAGGSASSVRTSVGLDPGQRRAVSLKPMPLTGGASYLLKVVVGPVAGQGSGSNEQDFDITVAG